MVLPRSSALPERSRLPTLSSPADVAPTPNADEFPCLRFPRDAEPFPPRSRARSALLSVHSANRRAERAALLSFEQQAPACLAAKARLLRGSDAHRVRCPILDETRDPRAHGRTAERWLGPARGGELRA